MQLDRYRHLDDQADSGLGAEELGTRRFTRLSEKSSAPEVAASEAEKQSNPNRQEGEETMSDDTERGRELSSIEAELASIPIALGERDVDSDSHVYVFTGGSVVRPASSRPAYVRTEDRPITVNVCRLVNEDEQIIERCLWVGTEDPLDPEQWLDLALCAATATHKSGLLGEHLPVPLPVSLDYQRVRQGEVLGGQYVAEGRPLGRYDVGNEYCRDDNGQDVDVSLNIHHDGREVWGGSLTPEQAIELAGHLITAAVAVRVHAEREAGDER